MHYPKVVGELETLRAVIAGQSIARYGDGEFKIATGGECVSQEADPALAAELSRILLHSSPHCLVGVPTMDPAGPKYGKWARYKDKYAKQLSVKRTYHSAFISRPDSAPWVNTEQFFDDIESLWGGKHVTLLGCGERSLKTEFLLQTGAAEVTFVQCPRRDAYEMIGSLESQILKAGPKVAILCAGPTATCLANRLSYRGIHAIDLGHIGMFWRRYLQEQADAH